MARANRNPDFSNYRAGLVGCFHTADPSPHRGLEFICNMLVNLRRPRYRRQWPHTMCKLASPNALRGGNHAHPLLWVWHFVHVDPLRLATPGPAAFPFSPSFSPSFERRRLRTYMSGSKYWPFDIAMLPVWRGGSFSFVARLGFRIVHMHVTPFLPLIARNPRSRPARPTFAHRRRARAGLARDDDDDAVCGGQRASGVLDWRIEGRTSVIDTGETAVVHIGETESSGL
ncbi:hypothetical protein EDB86DRAFT_2889452 [Lactarius hatsudake]|nr:hypothetical protein EDB86DRAFT_2889452 [Lactarius hatsudake]